MVVQYLKHPPICTEASKEEANVTPDVNPPRSLGRADIADAITISLYYYDCTVNN